MEMQDRSIDLTIKDSKGNVVFHITPTMEEVDGRAEVKSTMRRRELHDDRWYKVVVNQKLEKGETYTYEIKGIGINKKIPADLHFKGYGFCFPASCKE